MEWYEADVKFYPGRSPLADYLAVLAELAASAEEEQLHFVAKIPGEGARVCREFRPNIETQDVWDWQREQQNDQSPFHL